MKNVSTFEQTNTGYMNNRDSSRNTNPNYKPELREGVRSVEVPAELYSSDKVKSITLDYYTAQSVISSLPPSDKNNKEMASFVDIKINRAAEGSYGESVQTVTIKLDIVSGEQSEVSNIFENINKAALKFVLFKDLKPELNEEAQRLVKARELAKFIASNIDWKKA
jgi:hypothetical protein